MEILTIQEGEILIKRGDPLEKLYVILQGSVEQLGTDVRLQLGPGAVVGLTDAFHRVHESEYSAQSDLVVSAVDFRGVESFYDVFDEQPVYIFGFAKGAFRQCAGVLKTYENSREMAVWFYGIAMAGYRNYLHMCNVLKMPHKKFKGINKLATPTFSIGLEDWEINYISSLNSIDNKEIEAIYGKREEVVVGVIGTCCGYVDRANLALEEIVNYFECNSEIVLSASRTDLFSLMFDLRIRASMIGRDTTAIEEAIEDLHEFVSQSGLFNARLVALKWKEYQEYNFKNLTASVGGETDVYVEEPEDDDEFERKYIEWEESEYGSMGVERPEGIDQLEGGEIMVKRAGSDEDLEALEEETTEAQEPVEEDGIDCIEVILDYAGYDEKKKADIKEHLHKFGALTDKEGTDDNSRRVRKSVTEDFYATYEKAFFRAINEYSVSPIVKMFLHFGFMDLSLVGADYGQELFDLVDMLQSVQSDRVYTIYSWLVAVHKGEKEPSKNELDMDYRAYVYEERNNGHIREQDIKRLLEDNDAKVRFEMQNFFRAGNRITSGKMSAFCPVLCQEHFAAPPSRVLLTAAKISAAIDRVKDIDFGIFYRDVYFSDPDKGVKAETLKREVYPDVILMPNAGGRALMWSECAGVRKDTPARFIFPLFSSEEISKLMVPVCGAFRWEICRREQGVRWNDIANKCLTSDFYDYLTFYKKNRDLTNEGKEKVKNLLKSSRNNMREAFSRQYVSWIMYESIGSVRLNKVEREILIKYCPFRKRYRDALAINPLFKEGLAKYDVSCAQRIHHLKTAFAKLEQNGGVMTDEMKTTMEFYGL